MNRFCRPAVVAAVTMSVAIMSHCGGGKSQPTPQLSIATASLPNGSVGVPYTQTVKANGGAGSYTWSSIGALPPGLTLGNSVSNAVTISGTPDSAAQGVTFTIKVADSSSHSASQSYIVSIVGQPDSLTLSPPSLSFAPQMVGTASGQQETIGNSGTAPVLINSITLSGADAADFGQINTCGASLAAGANCTVNVTLTPAQPGPRVASVTIEDGTVGSPHSVAMSGLGMTSGPNATLSVTNLSFGDQAVGTTSSPISITLSNYGTSAVSISSVVMGNLGANYGENDNCVPSVASLGSCTINVTFSPLDAGDLPSVLFVSDGAPGSPHTVALDGTGTTTKPTLTGRCFGQDRIHVCKAISDAVHCPAGRIARQPVQTIETCISGSEGVLLDTSRSCSFQSGTDTFSGQCEAH
jgi:hypothetical protein